MAAFLELNEVFHRHYPGMLAWCRRHTPQSLGDPEEFVHTAFLRCRRHWEAGRRSTRCEAAYLYRALRWTVLDALRRRGRSPVVYSLSTLPDGEPADVNSTPWTAEEALAALSSRQREICRRYLSGQRDEQIRRELHLTAGALAVCLCRARSRLCRALEVDNGMRL